ncbi:MAG: MurT ligase domain-containing protein [Clostridiales bacterium]|jgi:UDP-N-acetylmuramyl tripeptide synthase|nr:MurT ligase domain-containing protein [Clostridiales bacterium]
MRVILAIWAAKILVIIGKLVGKKGSSTPGSVALKICPDMLRILAKKVPEIAVICGTNGKTTTNNLLCAIMQASGRRVICNHIGANMLAGVACAFAVNADIFGRIHADFAAIEVDEFSAVKVFEHFKPNFMIITNLFRDQLDRYGEIDIAISRLQQAIDMAPNCKLVLNADDPLVAAFACDNSLEVHYFGVGERVFEDDAEDTGERVTDGLFCRKCGEKLKYEYIHYNQLGRFFCTKCGFCRPHADTEAQNVELRAEGGLAFDVWGARIDVNYRGFYNIYNILAAMSVASLSGATDVVQPPSEHTQDADSSKINLAPVTRALADYQPQIGRMQMYKIGGKEFIFNLSKNPAGFNQAIKTIGNDPESAVIIAINDNEQDGIDISWIWDVDFELLNAARVFACGTRRDDLRVRLKYAETAAVTMCATVRDALEAARRGGEARVYVLVNYTALFPTEKLLNEMARRRRNP